MNNRGYFITGTDTGIGKTWATLALIQTFKARGLRVAGMKPVASGCDQTGQGLRNSDALAIQAQASEVYPYKVINPYTFKPSVAPHIAAELAGITIDIEQIVRAHALLAGQNDMVVIEGIGGWRVPLSAERSLVDLVRALNLPVILVVGLRLGCINHALLTTEAIISDGITLAGWIANNMDTSYLEPQRTVQTLASSIPAPMLGALPFLQTLNTQKLAEVININLL